MEIKSEPQLFQKLNYVIVFELKKHYEEMRVEMIKFGGSIDYFKGTPAHEHYMKIGKILGPKK